MTITLQLTTEQERRLEEGTARHDAEIVRQVLMQAVDATVDVLVDRPTEARKPDEAFEALSQRLADYLAATANGGHPSLSDEALTRAGIYGDHP